MTCVVQKDRSYFHRYDLHGGYLLLLQRQQQKQQDTSAPEQQREAAAYTWEENEDRSIGKQTVTTTLNRSSISHDDRLNAIITPTPKKIDTSDVTATPFKSWSEVLNEQNTAVDAEDIEKIEKYYLRKNILY